MSTLKDTLFEECMKCTICTEYCPVAAVNPAFPGPKQAGPDGVRLRLKGATFFDESLKYCTNCKRCEVACPSGVAIADLLALARKEYAKPNRSVRDALLSHTDLIGGMAATPLAPVANAIAKTAPVKKLLERWLGIPAGRTLPAYASGTFRKAFSADMAKKQSAFSEKVAFFHGCYINYNNPDLGRNVVHLLNALGVGVTLLENERCCGVPLIANGFFSDARKNALRNSHVIAATVAQGVPVLVASSTCTMTLRDEYPHVLEVDNSGWRKDVTLLTRYIHTLLERKPDLRFKPQNIKVAYHTSCHMERLGWSGYSIALLRMIPGLELRILPSQCCGIAGTYGFKNENYEAAQQIGASLFTEIDNTDAELIVTECETCKMQIEMSTSKRCEHPATILARSV